MTQPNSQQLEEQHCLSLKGFVTYEDIRQLADVDADERTAMLNELAQYRRAMTKDAENTAKHTDARTKLQALTVRVHELARRRRKGPQERFRHSLPAEPSQQTNHTLERLGMRPGRGQVMIPRDSEGSNLQLSCAINAVENRTKAAFSKTKRDFADLRTRNGELELRILALEQSLAEEQKRFVSLEGVVHELLTRVERLENKRTSRAVAEVGRDREPVNPYEALSPDLASVYLKWLDEQD